MENQARGIYTPHSAIKIDNNSGFETLAHINGWSGNGTQGNPYLISSYEINSNKSAVGGYMGNTTVYFILENCYIHNVTIGVYITNAEYGVVKNNIVLNTTKSGITVDGNFNIVKYNHISYMGQDGITVGGYNNIFAYNTISHAYWDGINIGVPSRNSTIIGNNISNCHYGEGIDIHNSYYNNITGNSIYNNSIYLYGPLNTFTTQNITSNNTVNGKPVYYYKNANMHNFTAPANAGELILGNVSWLTIKNITLSQLLLNIEIGYSSNITVINNTITNGRYAVHLSHSSLINITGNNITNNEYGIYIYTTQNSFISKNTLSSNYNGIYMASPYYATISTKNNTIFENNISYNQEGIAIWNSNENSIIKNTFVQNSNYAIYISSGSKNMLYENEFMLNHHYGDTQAYDGGSENCWNSSAGVGNYWVDWANNNNTNDQNHDGIVDWPYKIDGGNAMDYYPLKNYSMNNVLSHPLNLTARAGMGYVNISWKAPLYGTSTVLEYKFT